MLRIVANDDTTAAATAVLFVAQATTTALRLIDFQLEPNLRVYSVFVVLVGVVWFRTAIDFGGMDTSITRVH